MSILTKLLTGKYTRDTTSDAIDRFIRGEDIAPADTAAGAPVTIANSMQLSTVYACVRLLAWTIGSLPLITYKRLGRGKKRANNHPLYRLLHSKPNSFQTSFQWCSLMSTHQNLWGAGISEIQFDSEGQPIALWPIPPWRVTPKRSNGGDYFYAVDLDNGEKRNLIPEQVVVFPALSTSAFEWLSPISVHRETIGSAMAVKEFGARQFGQGTNPAGIVEYNGRLGESAEQSLTERLKKYSGLGRSHRVMLLDSGMKFTRVGLPLEDSQYLETRQFDGAEIARIFNVPLFLLHLHEKQTSWGTGIEEQKDAFVTFSLTPGLTQWEQELTTKLFYDNEYFPEFLLEGLLRGKQLDRVNAYKQLWYMGALSANDIREKENMNPVDGGDNYYVPLNMTNKKKQTEGVSENLGTKN